MRVSEIKVFVTDIFLTVSCFFKIKIMFYTHKAKLMLKHTSTGTAVVCMCAYCGIYVPCIAVLAAMNYTVKKTEAII